MRIHEIKRDKPQKKSTKVGRGGTRGKTSGRGHKGQKARAGRKIRPAMRDVIKKIPKKRGYRFNRNFDPSPEVVNVSDLEKNFQKGDLVDPKSLLKKDLVRSRKGKAPKVKILGSGEIKKALKFRGLEFSKTAREKVEKAGGEIN